jgi:two-component system NtrC family sensor kinase
MSDNEPDPADTTARLNNLGHLSAGVGHHVINAFSAIVSNAELLRLNPPLPSVADPATLAEMIVQTALEASTVARRLIDFTRLLTSIDPNQTAVEPSTIALDRLAGEFVAAEQVDGPPGVTWRTELNPIAPIRGHAIQLQAMLRHLISNAYEALPKQKGTISLSTSTDARGWVVLELRDGGAGMDEATMIHATEPFFSTKPGRWGIGLSIANGIWRRHRGTLSLRTQSGEGTLVRLCVEPLNECGRGSREPFDSGRLMGSPPPARDEGGRGFARELHGHARSLADDRGEGDLAAHLIDHLTADRQAEAASLDPRTFVA